jgi:hypothetical protein
METAIDCCPDQKAQKRLNTIHLLLCDGSFELARKHARISERCLQLWISRFNEQGIDGSPIIRGAVALARCKPMKLRSSSCRLLMTLRWPARTIRRLLKKPTTENLHCFRV